MNNIDVINIKEVLEFCKNPRPVYQLGGEIQVSEIENSTDEQLNNLLEAYKSAQIPGIRKMVDEIFEKFGEENDNMIALSAAKYYFDSRNTYELDDPLDSIDFDGFEHEYNPFYYPIARNWERKNWRDKNSKDDERLSEYWTLVEALCTKLNECSKFEYAEDYYRDNDALNEYWAGVIGITKDYKLVSFVIRDDGMLCNEDSMESYYNKIIEQL